MYKVFAIIFCTLYVFTSSVLTHVQAMGMFAEHITPCHGIILGEHTDHSTNTTTNDDCLENCLGYYDEVGSCYSEEKRTTIDPYTSHHVIDAWEVIDTILLSELGYYHTIDGWGHDKCCYLENYITITKKLE